MNRFEIISTNFITSVVNRQDVLELLYKAKHTKDDASLAIIRKELFQKIKPHFDNLKKVGVIITLFAFENNKTFLRVHKPNKFNDDLSKVRYSFKYANANKTIVRGLEEGKIMHAFRNIYPLYYKGEYLGSVDISFSSKVLERHMEKLYKTDTHFIINKSVFMSNIWKMKDMVNYIPSMEHIDFLYNINRKDNKKHFSNIETHLNNKLSQEIYKNIGHNNAFALEDNGDIVAFLPIKNIKDKKTIAYLVSYFRSDYLKDVVKKYMWINILAIILVFIISLLLYANMKKRLLLNEGLQREVQEQNKALEIIFEKASDGVIILENYKISQCNEAIVRMLGFKNKNQLIDKTLLEISPEFQEDDALSIKESISIIRAAENDSENYFEWKFVKADGETFWAGITLSVIIISDKKIIHGLIRDISKQKAQEEALLNEKIILNYKANHDVLTMLPNRALFSDRLNQAIKTSSRHSRTFGLMFIDLDKFKPINDTFGHGVGDKVLQKVSLRLKSVIREEDTLARYAGDEFTILMKELKVENDASVLAQKIIDILEKPMDIDGHELYVTSSIGISIYPQDAKEAHKLIRCADSAMYNAKAAGRNNFKFFAQ